MRYGVCPDGYIELISDMTKCRHLTGSSEVISKICPSGFTIDTSGVCSEDKITPVCPSGYIPIPTDPSNCATSTSSTVVSRTCPPGYTLQQNGLCSSGNTYATSGPLYCGFQYNGKGCTYRAQLTPGVTPATGNESGPNMICAFQEGDAQFPCDPGCCAGTQASVEPDIGSVFNFPIWAIILMIVVGGLLVAFFLAWAAKKMSTKQ